jgi:formylglycine-generating enzyme
MKTFIVILIGLFICMNLFAQNTNPNAREVWFEPAPNGFTFVHAGSFQDTSFKNNDTIIQTITVAPFWMSNEITNKEFREFTTYIKTNPKDSLCFIDWTKAYKENIDETKIDKAKYTKCMRNKDIAKNIIDTTAIFKDKPEFEDYFNNKKYDTYPVVGVSIKGATFFCIWKTKTEIETNKKNGLEYKINDYRIPVAEEWKYAASLVPSENKNKNNGLQKVNSGIKNELKLYNFSGNVSEWTNSSLDSISLDKKVVIGGSWKTKPNLYERNIVDKKTQCSYIGFRVVRSYISAKY